MHPRIRRPLLSLTGMLVELAGDGIDDPIVIVGSGRCGSTLLVDILGTHPALVGYPDEANDLWHPRTYPFEASEVAAEPIEADPAAFTELSIAHWPPHHARTIRRIFSGYRLIAGRARAFFVKSAMISFMIPTIHRIFPGARFVHLFRYGPAVVASYMKKNYRRYTRYRPPEDRYRVSCARYWVDCLEEIDRAARSEGLTRSGRFHEFRYEDLCRRPQDALDSLAGFLDLDPSGFSYDLSRIRARDHLAGEWNDSPAWDEALAVMDSTLAARGYR